MAAAPPMRSISPPNFSRVIWSTAGRCRRWRSPPTHPCLTAVGNDYGFEHVFERQVRGLGRPGDVFLAISTSGRSPNVLRALEAARDLGLVTVGFSGAAETAMRALCRHFLAVASPETAIVQQIHMVAGHAICALVERALAQ